MEISGRFINDGNIKFFEDLLSTKPDLILVDSPLLLDIMANESSKMPILAEIILDHLVLQKRPLIAEERAAFITILRLAVYFVLKKSSFGYSLNVQFHPSFYSFKPKP